MDFSALKGHTRLLIEADLQPLQGHRFQPTGFPDLGAAQYKLPGQQVDMVLLESPQSVANRLETTIWTGQALVEPLQGISYVVVERDGEVLTNSLIEAHRLNSYYILEGTDKSFFKQLQTELAIPDEGMVDFHQLAVVLAKYDLNSLLHGIFLAKKEIAGGRFKLARALSGFIEAYNVEKVASGGVKNDAVNPKADAKKGGGNIPFHREEYTAERITAYFSLDLAQIRGYRLGEAVEDLLIAIALWKIQRFLERGLRLRTACDLDCEKIRITRPTAGFDLPSHQALTEALPALVAAVAQQGGFADPPVTTVQYQPEAQKGDSK
jgi:CRISPR-associated protein Csb1